MECSSPMLTAMSIIAYPVVYEHCCLTVTPTDVDINFIIIEIKTTAEQNCWDILEVMSMNGCENVCATSVHHLLPGEVAFYHKNLTTRSLQVNILYTYSKAIVTKVIVCGHC